MLLFFLRSRGVTPDKSKAEFVDLLIDDLENHALKIRELVWSDSSIQLCIAQELSFHDLYFRGNMLNSVWAMCIREDLMRNLRILSHSAWCSDARLFNGMWHILFINWWVGYYLVGI